MFILSERKNTVLFPHQKFVIHTPAKAIQKNTKRHLVWSLGFSLLLSYFIGPKIQTSDFLIFFSTILLRLKRYVILSLHIYSLS